MKIKRVNLFDASIETNDINEAKQFISNVLSVDIHLNCAVIKLAKEINCNNAKRLLIDTYNEYGDIIDSAVFKGEFVKPENINVLDLVDHLSYTELPYDESITYIFEFDI